MCLQKCGVVWSVEAIFFGAVGYVDDINLLCPSVTRCEKRQVCNDNADQFNIRNTWRHTGNTQGKWSLNRSERPYIGGQIYQD